LKTLVQVAADLQSFFIERGWRFCFIGGVALQRWGRPRLTVDVDVTLLTGYGNEEHYIDALLDRYRGRIHDAAEFALANRVLLLQSKSGVGIDLVFGGLPFEEEAVARATDFEYLPGVTLRTCSAEDLVVMKGFANRTQDWADVESIADRQTGKLDLRYILSHLKPLAEVKGIPEALERIEALIGKDPSQS